MSRLFLVLSCTSFPSILTTIINIIAHMPLSLSTLACQEIAISSSYCRKYKLQFYLLFHIYDQLLEGNSHQNYGTCNFWIIYFRSNLVHFISKLQISVQKHIYNYLEGFLSLFSNNKKKITTLPRLDTRWQHSKHLMQG